jgi:hypothetical protein
VAVDLECAHAPWPDIESGSVDFSDLLSLLVGALGTYLAWLSIKMWREQDAVTAEQTRLAESMNGLLRRLTELESKQATMLER